MEKILESPLSCKEIQPVHLKEISPRCSLEGLMLKLKLQIFCEELTHWKRLWCWEGLAAGGEGTIEDEMAGWHHWHDGHESEWTPGVGDGQRGLACCDSWGCRESDMTVWLNWLTDWVIYRRDQGKLSNSPKWWNLHFKYHILLKTKEDVVWDFKGEEGNSHGGWKSKYLVMFAGDI